MDPLLEPKGDGESHGCTPQHDQQSQADNKKPECLNDLGGSGFGGYVSPYRRLTRAASLPLERHIGLEASMHAPKQDSSTSAAPTKAGAELSIDDLKRDSDFQSKPRSDLLLCEDSQARTDRLVEHPHHHFDSIKRSRLGGEIMDQSLAKEDEEDRRNRGKVTEDDLGHNADERILSSPASQASSTDEQTLDPAVDFHKFKPSHAIPALQDVDLLTGAPSEQVVITSPTDKNRCSCLQPSQSTPFPNSSTSSQDPKMLEFRYPLKAPVEAALTTYEPTSASYHPRSPLDDAENLPWARPVQCAGNWSYSPCSPRYTQTRPLQSEATDLLAIAASYSPRTEGSRSNRSPTTPRHSTATALHPRDSPYDVLSPKSQDYTPASLNPSLMDYPTSPGATTSRQQHSSAPVVIGINAAQETDDYAVTSSDQDHQGSCNSCCELAKSVGDLTETVKSLQTMVLLSMSMSIVNSRQFAAAQMSVQEVIVSDAPKVDNQVKHEGCWETEEEDSLATPRQTRIDGAVAISPQINGEIGFAAIRQATLSPNSSLDDENDNTTSISGSSTPHVSIAGSESPADRCEDPPLLVSGMDSLFLDDSTTSPDARNQKKGRKASTAEHDRDHYGPGYVATWKRVKLEARSSPPSLIRCHKEAEWDEAAELLARGTPPRAKRNDREHKISTMLSEGY